MISLKVDIPVLKQILSFPVNPEASAPGKKEEGCFELTLLEMIAALSSEDSENDIPNNIGNIFNETDEELMGLMEGSREARLLAVPEGELSPDLIWQWLVLAGAISISEEQYENIPVEESDGEMAESLEDHVFSMETGEVPPGGGIPLEESMTFGAEQSVAFEAEGSSEDVLANSAVDFDEIEPGNDPESSARKEGSAALDEPPIVSEKNIDGRVERSERSASEADSAFRESLISAGDKKTDSVQRSVSSKPEHDLQLDFLKFPTDLSGNKGVTSTMAEISQHSFERMRAQVVDQVFGRLAYFRENESIPAEMRLTLNPPSLGEVVIRVFSHQGKMTAEIITEMSRVKDMLENGMGEIKQRLQQVNLTLEKIDVFCSEHDLKRDLSYRQSLPYGRSVAERAGSRIGIVEEAVPEIWSVPVEGVSLELWA